MPDATPLCVRCLGPLIAIAVLFSPPSRGLAIEGQQALLRGKFPSAQPYEVKGAERRLLARFEGLIERTQWEDALDVADQLLASESEAVVAIDKARYVSLREYCHRLLTRLPAEILADYRFLVDAPAELWYRQGIVDRDEQLLLRVTDEAFCSSWGDDALNALGELALERGDYLSARMFWESISADVIEATESIRLTYPDTNLNLADVQARLVVVSLREGNFKRARNEIARFRKVHNDARGRLGGHEVVYVEALNALLKQAKSWPTKNMQANWPTYAGILARRNSSHQRPSTSLTQVWSHPLSETDTQQLSIFPVVIDNLVIYQGDSEVQALHLETGQVTFSSRGAAFESPEEMLGTNQQVSHTLMAAEHFVFGTTLKAVEFPQRQKSQIESVLWGIDLARDGALSLRKQMSATGEGFAGAPLVVGSQMFVTIRDNSNPAHVGIACYDLATEKLCWQKWICRTRGAATASSKQWTSNLLTYQSGMVFCCTNTGAIAALRAGDGKVYWIRNYERVNTQFGVDVHLGDFRMPNPCIYHQGLLFVAPQDSDKILALQADTGELLWQREMASLVSEIVGVASGKLIVSERGLYALDAITGEPSVMTHQANFALHGQPAITDNIVFWPTAEKIELIDMVTGVVLDQVVPWGEQGPANLILAGNYLIAVGRTQIIAYRFSAEPIADPQEFQNP